MRREKRREDFGDLSGYVLRYLVYNGDTIGSYGVMFDRHGRAFSASRDYHEIAKPGAIEARRQYENWLNSDDDGDHDFIGARSVAPCEYHDGKLCHCDGSSIVEVITDDDEACFAIAEMMAQ